MSEDKHYKYRAEVKVTVEGELDAQDHDEVKRKVEEDLRNKDMKNIKIRFIKTTVIEKDDDDDEIDFDLDLQYPFPWKHVIASLAKLEQQLKRGPVKETIGHQNPLT